MSDIPRKGPSSAPDVTALRASATRVLTSLLLTLSLTACASDTPPVEDSSLSNEPVSLLIYGHNYTDDFIDSFTVNGAGGGRLYVSSPTSGGGGGDCCINWRPGTQLPVKIRVRWVAGYCMFTQRGQFGDVYERRRNLWKEQDAYITEADPGKPVMLEVYFYPDGHIDAAVKNLKNSYSTPKLKLPRNKDYDRPGFVPNYPRCPDE